MVSTRTGRPCDGEGISVSSTTSSPAPPQQAAVATPQLIYIDNAIYDVGSFIDSHPGGSALLRSHVGTDATDVFTAFHGEKGHAVLRRFRVAATNKTVVPRNTHESGFRADILCFRAKLLKIGMFQSQPSYYLRLITINLAILATSSALALLSGMTWHPILSVSLSAALLAVFWQQSGWLAHDILHHSVFRGPRSRDRATRVGEIIGNIMQGFSVMWWKYRHNTHHAMPNVHTRDPDIDTMPILAWCTSDAKCLSGLWLPIRILISYQAYFFTIVASFARLAWAFQSLKFVLVKLIKAPSSDAIPHAILHFFLAQMLCGLLLASVFSLNHNGTRIFSTKEASQVDFFTLQVLTGRDLHSHWFTNWFCGGLNFQIEHHLFPTMPRHNYPKIQHVIRMLCKTHGVEHHMTTFIGGTIEVFQRLYDVSHAARD